MPLPSQTIVADIVIATPWAERRCRNYYQPDIPPSNLTQLEAVANAILLHYQTSWASLSTTQCWMRRVESRFYGGPSNEFEANSTGGGTQGSAPAATPGGGSDDGTTVDTLADEHSLIVQIRTGQSGRSKRGRRFICGLSEKVQNAGKISMGFIAACKSFADKFPADVTVNASGLSTALHARHYDRKNSVLVPITKAYALATLGSRIDRRNPLRLSRL